MRTPPPRRRLPLLQETEPKLKLRLGMDISALSLISYPLRPLDPAGPCGPVLPTSPLSPLSPLSPFGPWGPVGKSTTETVVYFSITSLYLLSSPFAVSTSQLTLPAPITLL